MNDVVACFGRCGSLVSADAVVCGNPRCYQKMMNRMSDAVSCLYSTRYKAFAAHKSDLLDRYREVATHRDVRI